MKNGLFGLLGVVVALAAVVVYLAVYIVSPTQQALVLQFGKVISATQQPGLHFKLPLVQNVIYIDKRILDLNMPPLEAIASDKKRLMVDAFARYRISDPVLFFQRVNNVNAANQRLSTLLQSSLRSELGKATFTAVVRDNRTGIMESIRRDVSASAAELGLEVVDVKIRRADLPEANSQAVFQRMQTERQREATEIRAQGEEQARRIRSRADRDATVLIAEARRDAEIIRGDGDAERNRIFAEAFSVDPDFFAFYRSMQAYEAGLRSGETSLVLSPDSSFFRYFNDPAGAGRPAAAAAQ
ncbi:protease modulator HflC [Microvirga tunisiensis]|uniref:Protease modulator HflC n=2 Tax=Pannonibacter tanglangensis TaxID=2750084 RepID=A0ABW9ZEY0_9HYPH|nr:MULTISPECIES: protease modulator HflC [unclassified Pannonibacter]NBN63400.1 protease modulator HflC [Pannonibacter sp. XCT-34]NBN77035.1 protease modulator HflC [Pannonibacter sp. XCT-53]